MAWEEGESGGGGMYKAKTAFWNDGSVITNPAAAQQK